MLGSIKLTYEERSTALAQIEACLNSHPLVLLPTDDDGIGALTPGHFLIGRPLEALLDSSFAYAKSLPLLKRWQLCQSLIQHFWKRWSGEYVTHLGRITKRRRLTRNFCVGDMVILCEDSVLPTKWPLGKVIEVYPGKGNLVRVATVKTHSGICTRPVTKLALLLPSDQ